MSKYYNTIIVEFFVCFIFQLSLVCHKAKQIVSNDDKHIAYMSNLTAVSVDSACCITC